MIIEIETKKGKFNFIFDTASNISIIDSTLARKLNLPFGKKSSFPSLEGALPGYRTIFEIFEPMNDLSWITLPFDTVSKNLDYKIHGLIGTYGIVLQNVVEINFVDSIICIGGTIEKSNKVQRAIQLNSINNANDRIAKYFPKYASICDTIEFNNSYMEVIDLIIDTGSKFGLVFLTSDSIQINRLKNNIDTYKLISRERKIAYCNARVSGFLLSELYSAPIFYDPLISSLYKNSFIGLLGIPFLSKYQKIEIDYPDRKLYLVK